MEHQKFENVEQLKMCQRVISNLERILNFSLRLLTADNLKTEPHQFWVSFDQN